MFIFIVAIAVAILLYFSFFAGKQAAPDETETEIVSHKLEDSVVGASVRDKYIEAGSRGLIVRTVVFACDDGVEREFTISEEIFDAIRMGERDTLIYSGAMFLGFGEHGGAEIPDGEADNLSSDSDFSYDDFDESIDIEQSIAMPDGDAFSTEDSLSVEDKEHFEQFLDYVRLPAKSETVEDETDSLAKYNAAALLQRVTLYPFLKREGKVARMFDRTYRDAIDDMLGYAGESRQGKAADGLTINDNEIRVVITVQELPPPLRNKITAEFGVND